MSPTYQQLRAHERRIAGMLADPELLGDLLLVGIVFARALDLGDPPLDRVAKECAKMVYGRAYHSTHLHGRGERDERGSFYPTAAESGVARVRDVLRADIRRYVADVKMSQRCQRPVQRRRRDLPPPGSPFLIQADMTGLVESRSVCGRNPDWRDIGPSWLIDPVDGTRHAFAACSQERCKRWLRELVDRNAAEVAANPPPEPVANRGGVLARHLNEIDWPKLYHHLDPRWKPPHEAPGWRPPKLTVVLGDEQDDDESAVVERPTFTVLDGGWS